MVEAEKGNQVIKRFTLKPAQRFFAAFRVTKGYVILSPAVFFSPERRISGCAGNGMESAVAWPGL
jgi:hypothetical protein